MSFHTNATQIRTLPVTIFTYLSRSDEFVMSFTQTYKNETQTKKFL